METRFDKREIDIVVAILHRGRSKAVLSDKIAHEIGRTSRTNEYVRSLIRHMVEECGYCIGSNKHGYYMIDDPNDLQETVGDLESRAFAMLTRKKILVDNFNYERNLDLCVE